MLLFRLFVAIVLQPFFRFDLEDKNMPDNEWDSGGPSMWRVPVQTSGFRLPDWYKNIDPSVMEGIIELPLEISNFWSYKLSVTKRSAQVLLEALQRI